MLQTLLYAQRNLLRHRRRTLTALGAISFGIIALIIATGFIQWIFWIMRESTIESRLGHIQVTRPGYFAEGAADPFRYLLPPPDDVFREIAARPDVKAVAPRLGFNGLIAHGDTTVSFQAEGVDPEAEMVAGKSIMVTRGARLDAADPKGMLLGKGLAATLGVGVGDSVVLLVNTPGGGANALEGKVRGIFFTSIKAYDDMAVRLPLASAEQLLRREGAHTWVVVLRDTDRTDAVLQELRVKYAHRHLEFTPWYRLAEFYNKTVALFSRQVAVVWAMIGVIILLSISNTLTMVVLERTGEIATQLALGDRRGKIFRLLFAEGVLLGVAGGALGAAVGAAAGMIISAIGIPMPPAPGMDVAFTGHVRITLPLVLEAWLVGALATALAALFPAWKASRVPIVTGLRFNR